MSSFLTCQKTDNKDNKDNKDDKKSRSRHSKKHKKKPLCSDEIHSILEEELQCPACLDICFLPISFPCGHNMCQFCLTELNKKNKKSNRECPTCRGTITGQETVNRPLESLLKRLLSQEFYQAQVDEKEYSIKSEDYIKHYLELDYYQARLDAFRNYFATHYQTTFEDLYETIEESLPLDEIELKFIFSRYSVEKTNNCHQLKFYVHDNQIIQQSHLQNYLKNLPNEQGTNPLMLLNILAQEDWMREEYDLADSSNYKVLVWTEQDKKKLFKQIEKLIKQEKIPEVPPDKPDSDNSDDSDSDSDYDYSYSYSDD